MEAEEARPSPSPGRLRPRGGVNVTLIGSGGGRLLVDVLCTKEKGNQLLRLVAPYAHARASAAPRARLEGGR